MVKINPHPLNGWSRLIFTYHLTYQIFCQQKMHRPSLLSFILWCMCSLTNNLPLEDWFQSVFTPRSMQQPFWSCYSSRPTEVEHNFSLSIVTAFVNISAGFLLPWIFSSTNTSSSNKDLMKW